MQLPSKAEFRKRVRSHRNSLAFELRAQNSLGFKEQGRSLLASLPSTTPGSSVCAYLAMGAEPDIQEFLTSLHAEGRKVFVPVCEQGFELSWVAWFPGVRMERSQLAPVDEPVGTRLPFDSLAAVNLILIPALALSHDGIRLGQGGGYYDRFLESLKVRKSGTVRAAPPAIAGVVLDEELLPAGSIPHEPFDQAVNLILTPTRWTPAAPLNGSQE